jgi:alpha-mannosidase
MNMTLNNVSILLPCQQLDHFPTHLAGREAAELLAAWTALWHPALIDATGRLPGWHPAEAPPDPSDLRGELIFVPSVSGNLAGDWLDRIRATVPTNPPPVIATESRDETITAALAMASLAPDSIEACLVADFLALGFAHLQVELLTRAMRYSTVLDDEQFASAVVAGASAAVAGDGRLARDELGRAFDLLADARNHVYAVDFYVVDVTLLVPSTLHDGLRSKLDSGFPTSLLVNGELIDQIAGQHPRTLAALRQALEVGTACIIGGLFSDRITTWRSPEAMLAELEKGQQSARRHLGRECEVFAQFHAAFSPLMPEILTGMGFTAALHVAFDGGQLPRADQCKTRWGERDGAWLEALSSVPLDASRPETWLKYAEHLGDTISHDHVATLLLASWPGQPCVFHQDLQRAAAYNSVLGKLVTLEEYFRISRETDEWTTFTPREYPLQSGVNSPANPISTRVNAYREDVTDVYGRLLRGLSAIADSIGDATARESNDCRSQAALNPWSFACTRLVGLDPLCASGASDGATAPCLSPTFLSDMPGCGYAHVASKTTERDVTIADGHILRNELLELTVSETTGGIQALRTHRDRGTRVSQRLVFHRSHVGGPIREARNNDAPKLDTQMIADEVAVTRNDSLLGEITSQGRLVDLAGQLLAQFTQRVRVARGLPAAIVDIELEPHATPGDDLWKSYFASRLAWLDEAVSIRRGRQWLSQDTARERIESSEWVEISEGSGNIVCFGMGLPFHRRAGSNWLDTLLYVTGEASRRYQFALGIDCPYPTHTTLALLTAGTPTVASLPFPLAQPRGWFLHLGARNLIMTHLELLNGESDGIRCRILETVDRGTETTLAAFRPFRTARITDFRGAASQVLSVVDGAVRFEIGPHRWIQLEAEW